jgi:hypothetical protein
VSGWAGRRPGRLSLKPVQSAERGQSTITVRDGNGMVGSGHWWHGMVSARKPLVHHFA